MQYHYSALETMIMHAHMSTMVCCAMKAWMLLWELGRMGRISQFQMGEAVYPYTLLAPFVLSAAVSIALTALVGWHLFLIWQGQVSSWQMLLSK